MPCVKQSLGTFLCDFDVTLLTGIFCPRRAGLRNAVVRISSPRSLLKGLAAEHQIVRNCQAQRGQVQGPASQLVLELELLDGLQDDDPPSREALRLRIPIDLAGSHACLARNQQTAFEARGAPGYSSARLRSLTTITRTVLRIDLKQLSRK